MFQDNANYILHINHIACCGNYAFRKAIRKYVLFHNCVRWSWTLFEFTSSVSYRWRSKRKIPRGALL